MPFHITCICGRLTVVPDEASGQSIHCLRCNRELTIPAVDAAQPPPAPSLMPVSQEEADAPTIVVETQVSPRRHTQRSRELQAVTWITAALALIALLSVVPVVVAQLESTGQLASPILERWALAIVLAAILHVVYILYLIQFPDWSCVWVVSLFLLLVTTLYATLLGIRLLAPDGNRIMELLELDGNQFSSAQEAGWCFLMVLITGVTSYLAGRVAAQWYRRSHNAAGDSSPTKP